MEIKKGVKILNVEGKDLIKKTVSKFNSKGNINTKKYKGDFDYSLLLIKLIEKYGEDAIYNEIDEELYSDVLICVNFNYGLKDVPEEEMEEYLNKYVVENINKIEKLTAAKKEKLKELSDVMKNKIQNIIKGNESEVEKLRDESKGYTNEINKITQPYKYKYIKERSKLKEDDIERINELNELLRVENIYNELTGEDKNKVDEFKAKKEVVKLKIKNFNKEQIEEVKNNTMAEMKSCSNAIKEDIKVCRSIINSIKSTDRVREHLYINGFEIREDGEFDECYWKMKSEIDKLNNYKGNNENTKKQYEDNINRFKEELNIISANAKTTKYVRFIRSSGSSRVGKCLYIKEEYYDEMIEWLKHGLNIAEGEDCDLAGVEAYLSLMATSIMDTFKMESKHILLVDDVESKFKTTAMVTRLGSDGLLHTKEEELEMTNSIFDGSSLIDFSILKEEYCKNGGVQLRNAWFKGFAFACDIKKFMKYQFKDSYKNAVVYDMFGNPIKVSDIKLITTPSSLKYLKNSIGGTYKEWLDNLELMWEDEENKNIWGICSTPHDSKFINGTHVQSHYQLLNNLQLTEDEVKELLKSSLEYIKLLKNDLRVFKQHIKTNANKLEEKLKDDLDDIEAIDNENKISNSMNDFMYQMITLNKSFANTEIFKNYRSEAINNYIENIKRGHVLINGNYSVIIANSIDYLYHAIGKLEKNDNGTVISKMKCGSEQCEVIMCDRFNYGDKLLLSRSPMPVQGNIVIANNIKNNDILTYFSYENKMPKNVVHINATSSNIMERGSSLDFDGDKFLITDNKVLVESAIKNYDTFKVPVNKIISKDKLKYSFTNADKCRLDIRTAKNNIGRIINDSMILVSELWNRVNNGEEVDEKLYSICSELSIMSCVSIDSAKKVMPYDEEKILSKIEECEYYQRGEYYKKEKDEKGKVKVVKDEEGNNVIKEGKIRPLFFSIVGEGKNYRFEEFKCTMDILNKYLGTNAPEQPNYNVKNKSKIPSAKNKDTLDLMYVFSKAAKVKTGSINRRRILRFINYVKDYACNIKGIRGNDKLDSKERYREMKFAEKEYLNIIKEDLDELTVNEIALIIKMLNKKGTLKDTNNNGKQIELSKISRNLIYMLYKNNTIEFLKLIKEDEPLKELECNKKGKINIFGFRYK